MHSYGDSVVLWRLISKKVDGRIFFKTGNKKGLIDFTNICQFQLFIFISSPRGYILKKCVIYEIYFSFLFGLSWKKRIIRNNAFINKIIFR